MASIIVKVSASATRAVKASGKKARIGYKLGTEQAKVDVTAEELRAARKLIKMGLTFEQLPKWARKALIAAGDFEAP